MSAPDFSGMAKSAAAPFLAPAPPPAFADISKAANDVSIS